MGGTFKTLQRGGLWKYLGNSQNTTGQPEVQGTQTQHNQKYKEDLDNLGNRGGLIAATGGHFIICVDNKCDDQFSLS